MDIERIRLYLLTKRGCTEDTPFGEDVLTFRVLGKIFACLDLTRPDRVVLKTTPERSGELYVRYTSVFGAWHWNKQNWLEAEFGGDADDALILCLADEAYAIVLHALPKKRQIAFLKEGLPPTVCFSHTNTCTSTMELAWSLGDAACAEGHYEAALVHSDLQRTGRGQQGTRWESQNGKNLTFSLAVSPAFLPPLQSFRVLQTAAVALVRALAPLLSGKSDALAIKWPNDIYYGDCKLCGTLIQNSVMGGMLRLSVIGIGLNVNQTMFSDGLPNPISLAQILGTEVNRFVLLEHIIAEFLALYADLRSTFQTSLPQNIDPIEAEYFDNLYHRKGLYDWRDRNGQFSAFIDTVLPDGTLRLRLPDSTSRDYVFKEVEYVI